MNNAIFFTHISERLVIKYARHSFKGTVWTTLRAGFFMTEEAQAMFCPVEADERRRQKGEVFKDHGKGIGRGQKRDPGD